MNRFIKSPTSASGLVSWRSAGPSLLVREDSRDVPSCKIAGFDLNDTLVGSKTGQPGYAVTVSDWKLYHAMVPAKLRELHGDGFRIVIFTNQGNIRGALEGKRAQAFKAYVDAFLKEVEVPALVIAATSRDKFRKPSSGMWNYLEEKASKLTTISKTECFYVGDAAGGPGEHSADDSDFAKNVGITFIHVNDYFPAEGGQSEMLEAGLNGIKRAGTELTLADAKKTKITSLSSSVEKKTEYTPGQQVVLILVGAPGSGKSTFADKLGPPAPAGSRASAKASGGGVGNRGHLRWRRVCQDLLGSKDACLRAARTCLEQGHSIIIDRTNYNAEQRATWINLAQDFGAQCHIVVFDIPADVCCSRVQLRTSHEGGLQGFGSNRIVSKMLQMLEPISDTESASAHRVALVHCDADLQNQLLVYEAVVDKGTDGPNQTTSSLSTSCCPPSVTSSSTTTVQAATVSFTSMSSASETTAAFSSHPSHDAEEDVKRLMALGFSCEECSQALKACSNNVNEAANRLLSERLVCD